MTGVETLVARVGMATIASVCGVPLACSKRIHRPPSVVFDRMVAVGFICSRLAVYATVFFLLRLPLRGDLPGFYLPQARAVLAGLEPYRGFKSSYGPLHGYLDAGLLTIWNSGLVIVLFTIVMESTLLPLWLKLGRCFVAERNLRIACALYLASPFSIQFVSIDGQNTVLIAVWLAIAMLLIQRNRNFYSGAAVGASLVLIKFLPALYIPSFFLGSPRRWRWIAGCTAVVLAGYSFLLLARAPILQPLLMEGQFRTSGNLPYLMETIFNVTISGRIWDVALFCALAGVFLFMVYVGRRNGRTSVINTLTFGMVALTLTLLLFSMKAQPAYLMMILYPMYLLFRGPDSFSLIGLSLFSVVALAEPSVWFGQLGYVNATQLHQLILHRQPGSIWFLMMDVIVLGGYGWLLWKALERIGMPVTQPFQSTVSISDSYPPEERGNLS